MFQQNASTVYSLCSLLYFSIHATLSYNIFNCEFGDNVFFRRLYFLSFIAKVNYDIAIYLWIASDLYDR